MPSTYSTSLRLELIGNGEQAGNWGNTNNINLGTLLEQAIAGVEYIAISGTSYTLTTGNGVSDQARNAVIVLTGTLSANCNVIVPSVDKTYTFRNATTGGFSVVVKTAAGSGVTIANGLTQAVYCDATNVVAAGPAFNNATNSVAGNLVGGVSVNAGTAAAPSITFTGDPDTGLFNAGANEIGFSTAGADRVRIGSSGNVGIGTSIPGYKLDITGQARATTGWALTLDGSTFTPSGLAPIPNYGLGAPGSNVVSLAGFGGLSFYTNQNERLRLSDAGQLQNSAGTAAAPAYSFAGDTDTGVYNSGSNEIGFSVGGSRVFNVADGTVIVDRTSAGDFSLFLRNNSASGAVTRNTVIATLNESSVPVSAINNLIQSDGGSQTYFEVTPAGSRASDRRVTRMTIPGSGPISMVGPVNVSSGGQTVTGDLEASGNLRFNSGYGSAAIAYGVRAWVNFNGTGTVAIRGNGGVTSITDNGTGDYTVNFNFTMPDTNYAVVGNASGNSIAAVSNVLFSPTRTTSSCRVLTSDNNTDALQDNANVDVIIVR